MKRKQTLKALIAAAMAAVMLTGCADRANSSDAPNAAESSTVTSTVSSTDVSSVTGGEGSSGTGSSEVSSTAPTSSSAPGSTVTENSSAPESKPESSAPESKPESSVPESKPENSSATESKPESTPSTDTSGGSGTSVSGSTPFAKHGSLSVNGADLVDANGAKFQLRGMSTHGLAWYPQFVNYDTFKFLRDDWNTNCIRLAMYTAEYGGYCSGGDQAYLKQLVSSGVDYATQLGMYVIVDWHILSDQNPLTYKNEAIKFFDEMSKKYANNGNVIYEICNEPNGSGSWNNIKTYANEVIPVIRANSPNSVILVGTPTWSQDIDQAAASPLSFKNVMYSLHFYAATHTDWLRNRMESCIKSGLPVFISEFGTCDASGNGAVDEWQSNEWKKLIDKYNTSYMCWNLANKNESSSILKESCQKLTGWSDSDLNKQGILVRGWFKGETD